MGKGAQNAPMVISEDSKALLSGHAYGATKLAPEDEWIGKFDFEGFKSEVAELGKELANNQGPADLKHLHKIIWWHGTPAPIEDS